MEAAAATVTEEVVERSLVDVSAHELVRDASLRAVPLVGERSGLLDARGWELLAKRTIDLVLSIVLSVVLLPFVLAAALAVVLTSAGGPLYVQERLGKDARPIRLYKLRSMYRDADARIAEIAHLNECDGPVFKIRRDPRITPVGRFIRKFSIDELPQLWNVIRGDMSLVGPRPPLASEYETYLPHQRARLLVTPGLTCTWQVSGRSDIDFESWVEMDLEYIRSWTLVRDIELLVRTVPAVATGRGAY